MNKYLSARTLLGLLLLLLVGSCDLDIPAPVIRKTDVIIEGRITTDGSTPLPNIKVTLVRDVPLSLDNIRYYEKTDNNGYFKFKFKANHELNDRKYYLNYDIYDVDKDIYYCPSNYLTLGYLPSADTTLVYNFTIPRKTEIQCVYKDTAKAREYEYYTTFQYSCGLVSDSTMFLNTTGGVSMNYTEKPLYIPANIPVIVVTRGLDRKQSKALEKKDTIVVSLGTPYVHQVDF